MFMEVKQKNPNYIEQLKLRYKQEPLEAAVGFPKGSQGVGNPHYDTGASILEAAIWNNFGTETIPRRAFMELAAKWMQPKYKKMMREAVKRINSGEITLKDILTAAGAMGQAEVQKAIVDGEWTPNSPDTIKRKGEGKDPLTDSGDMANSAGNVVRARTK